MKALVYTAPEQMVYQAHKEPNPQQGEELIRIDSVGICGSDMHAYLGHDNRRPAPLILGHEAAGTITGGKRNGERVTINPLVSCGHCKTCQSKRENLCPNRQIISMPPREGAFAEWLTMPLSNLITVPDGISLEKAALVEPIACGWHATRLARQILSYGKTNPNTLSDRKALVIGGGAIGLGAALSLRAKGAKEITIFEQNSIRRDYLKKHCGEHVIAPNEWDDSILFDIVVDSAGFAATREIASRQTHPGGVIVHIGLGEDMGGLDIRRMTLQEITFIGTYTYTQNDFKEAAEALFEGKLGDLNWFDDRPLKDGAKAFADIRRGQVAAPKVILKP